MLPTYSPQPTRSARSLQRLQERDEVRLLSVGQSKLEAAVVELHHLLECGSRPVVEIGRAGGQAAKDRSLELPDVGPFSGDHRASRIGGLHRRAIGNPSKCVERKI